MGNLCGLRINPTQPELTMVGIDPFFHKSKNVQIQFCQIYIPPHTFFSEIGLRVNLEVNNRLLENI